MNSYYNIYNLMDPCSLIYESMILFHDYVMLFVLLIVILVFSFVVSIVSGLLVNKYLLHNEWAESLWTLLPMVILCMIALPSLELLYSTDDCYEPEITYKAIGQQWSWNYEILKQLEFNDDNDFNSELIDFNSACIVDQDTPSNFRLLDVDNRVVMPTHTNVRMLTTSSDVIHSWTVPSLGVKMDSNPGRLNQMMIYGNRAGLHYGQCSEICGAYHSFMPICVEMVDRDSFFNWIINWKDEK